MVDARFRAIGRSDDLAKRVRAVEQKIDQLSVTIGRLALSMDRRFEQLDRHLEQIEAAIVEPRPPRPTVAAAQEPPAV